MTSFNRKYKKKILLKKVKIEKSVFMSLTHSLLTPVYQQRTCPKILEFGQNTKFDMGFQI
jgi:hypothetical protein